MLEPWQSLDAAGRSIFNAQPGDPPWPGPDDPIGEFGKKRVKRGLFEAQGGRCAYCEQKMLEPGAQTPRGNPMVPTLDRIIPGWAGGPYTLRNLVVACLQCNRLKGSMSIPLIRQMLSNLEHLMKVRHGYER